MQSTTTSQTREGGLADCTGHDGCDLPAALASHPYTIGGHTETGAEHGLMMRAQCVHRSPGQVRHQQQRRGAVGLPELQRRQRDGDIQRCSHQGRSMLAEMSDCHPAQFMALAS